MRKWGVITVVIVLLILSLAIAKEKNNPQSKLIEEPTYATNSQDVSGYVVVRGNVEGLNVVDKLERDVFVVNMNKGLRTTTNEYEILGKIKPEAKIKQQIEDKAKIFFYSDVPEEERETIAKKYGRIITNDLGAMVIRIRDNINGLADEENVFFIEAVPELESHNNGSRLVLKTDSVWKYLGFQGNGTTVALWDSGVVETTHDDFAGRSTVIDTCGNAWDTGSCSAGSHATHVAGTMAGAGIQNPAYKGHAPNVTNIVSWEWPEQASEIYNETNISIATYGSVLSQNSWGYTLCYNGDYNSISQAFDRVVYGNTTYVDEKITIVFSAGNDGTDGFNSTCGPGGTAKNVISVGSIDYNDMLISSFSSLGPTDDGRIKPDVVAAGCERWVSSLDNDWIVSTIPVNTYGELGKCGTSMAAPAVSGVVALMHEAYNSSGVSDMLPSTDKAILIHTATDMGNTGPDYTYGWGLVEAKKAVKTALNGSEYIIEGNISTGEVLNYSFNLSHTAEKLRVTLAWSDPPSTPFANIELATDLDLNVTNPSGTGYFGWLLDKDNPEDAATKAMYMGESDGRNNVEQVEINNPSLGEYNITVKGYYVTDGPQEFSLIFYQDIFENETPQVNFTTVSPVDEHVNRTVIQNISVTAQDNVSQIINCSLEINGTTNYSMNVDAFITNTTCHFEHTFTEDTNVTYKVYAQDYNENWGVSEQRYIDFTNHTPTINNEQLTYLVNESGYFNITINATDLNPEDTLTYGTNFSQFTQSTNVFNWTTNYADAGTYSVLFNVTDGTTVINQTMTLIVQDVARLNANSSQVASSIELNIFVNGSLNETELTDVNEINITDALNNSLVTFDWNFSQANMSFNINYSSNDGTIVVSGLNLSSQNKTKTVYINKSNSNHNYICILDMEVDTISAVSSTCENDNETRFECPGSSGSYTCAVEGDYFKVSGLNHTAVKGITVSTGGGSPGGGGSGGDDDDDEDVVEICREDWICEGFGNCEDGKQTQRCFDANVCGTTLQQPLLEKDCVVETPDLTDNEPESEPEPEPDPVSEPPKESVFKKIGNWFKNIFEKAEQEEQELQEQVDAVVDDSVEEQGFDTGNFKLDGKMQNIVLFGIIILVFLIVIAIVWKK